MQDAQSTPPVDASHRVDPRKPRKEEILDAATRLLAERGYDGTSMNDVAERVGMRKASLFYHFASKDALYEAVLDRLVGRLASPLAEVYMGRGSFVERLDTAVDALTSALGASPFAARLLLRTAMDWGPVMQGTLSDKVNDVLEAGAAFVRAGQDAGEFVDGDARQLVLTALGAHFLPFALGRIVERFAGADPFAPAFVAVRSLELRRQVHNMLVKRGG